MHNINSVHQNQCGERPPSHFVGDPPTNHHVQCSLLQFIVDSPSAVCNFLHPSDALPLYSHPPSVFCAPATSHSGFQEGLVLDFWFCILLCCTCKICLQPNKMVIRSFKKVLIRYYPPLSLHLITWTKYDSFCYLCTIHDPVLYPTRPVFFHKGKS